MRIVYVYADTAEDWNCSEWRCAVPQRAINRSGKHSAQLLSIDEFAFNTPKSKEICGPADVIVVQRNLFGNILAAIQHWKARDKVIVADFDDAYPLMEPSNPSYPFWHQGISVLPNGQRQKIDPPPLTQFKWGLRLVNAATVPSEKLADDWRSFADIHYLPNYIDISNYQNTTLESHEGIIIGWGGSVSHLQSFSGSGILNALQNVCQARPKVKVMICGSDRRIFEDLPLPAEQKILAPWVPYQKWPSILAKFDIGLAPLSGAYDERRSWIKVLEYMLMKIPWVATEGPAYHNLRDYGWLVNNSEGAWERVLMDMVDHLDHYKVEAAQRPYLFGLRQSIDENIDKVVAIYNQVLTNVRVNAI